MLPEDLPLDAPRFAAEILTASSAGLARLAAEKVVPRLERPEVYGTDPLGSWRQHITGRLADLSLALADGRQPWFADQVGWAKVALRSRGAPESDLLASLQCLREVLAAELPDRARAPCVACLDDVIARFDALGVERKDSALPDTVPGRLASRYVLALLEGDRRKACDLVVDAVRDGRISAQDALLDVCLAAQRELGRMWHLDEITVAEEHFVSTTTVRLLAQILAVSQRAPANGRTVLAAAVAQDGHDIGLRAVADLFELDGWRVVFLGAQVPVDDLVWATEAFRPDVIVLSGTLGAHVRGVADAVRTLRERSVPVPPVIVGGHAFPPGGDAQALVDADVVVHAARDCVPAARRLLGLDATPAA